MGFARSPTTTTFIVRLSLMNLVVLIFLTDLDVVCSNLATWSACDGCFARENGILGARRQDQQQVDDDDDLADEARQGEN